PAGAARVDLRHPVGRLLRPSLAGLNMSFRVPEVLIRFGNASYAGKTSNGALLSSSCRRVPCKERFQRLLGEAPAGHGSGSGETAPELRPLSRSTLGLGLESRDRV